MATTLVGLTIFRTEICSLDLDIHDDLWRRFVFEHSKSSRLWDSYEPTSIGDMLISLVIAAKYESMFINDMRFVHSDPHDGVWDSGHTEKPNTAWDDVYAGMIIQNKTS